MQLKNASGALENLQALHENIVQSMSGGVITTGPDGRITLVNRAAQQLLEISRRRIARDARSAIFFRTRCHILAGGAADAEVRYGMPKAFAKRSG